MFLLELLNFTARILLMIITLCCMIIIGTGKSLIQLARGNQKGDDDVQ